MKRLWWIILVQGIWLTSLAAQQPVPATGAASAEGLKGLVSGVVVQSTTGSPISRVTVTLTSVPTPGARGPAGQPRAGQNPASQPSVLTTTTDEQGRFQFENVEPASYRLVAARNGYARQEYGQRSFNRPGTVLTVGMGQQLTGITLRLTPAGTFSGRVLDGSGEPLAGITVQALRSSYDAMGQRTLQPVASARTNDLGEYRLYWVNPGRYVLSANAARSMMDLITAGASQAATQAQNPAQAQAASQATALFGAGPGTPNEVVDPSLGLTFYPGTPDFTRAVALDLPPGRELRADFTMTPSPRFRVSGRVVDSSTGSPPQNASLSIVSRDANATTLLDLIAGMDPAQGNRYNPATGEFVVSNVATGSYWIQVIAQGQTPTTPPTAAEALSFLNTVSTGRIAVDVAAGDISGLVITTSAGLSVQGRIRVDGGESVSAADLQRIGVNLFATSGGPSLLTILQGLPNRPAADGTFSIPRISPGDYRLQVTGTGPRFYVKEARFGRYDALTGLTITGEVTDTIDLLLRPNPGQVTGTVVDATNQPAAGVQAVLIPQNRQRQDLYRTIVTGQDGRFTMQGVVPGDYRMFSWEDIEPFSYFDPAVLEQFETAGVVVRVQESSSEQVQIKIIPAPAP